MKSSNDGNNRMFLSQVCQEYSGISDNHIGPRLLSVRPARYFTSFGWHIYSQFSLKCYALPTTLQSAVFPHIMPLQ